MKKLSMIIPLVIVLVLCGCSLRPKPASPSSESTTAVTSVASSYSSAAESSAGVVSSAISSKPGVSQPASKPVSSRTSVKSSTPGGPTVKYSIDARKAVDKSTGKSFGMLLPECDVPLQSGDTVYSVLKRICKLKKLALDATTIGEAYVKGIGGAEEFDNGPQSGWIYRLNGVYAASGCSIKLKAGDRVEWIYTTDYGKSEGGTK